MSILFQNDVGRRIFEAAEKGNSNTLRTLLKDADAGTIEWSGVNGRFPLPAATYNKHHECMKMLLNKGDTKLPDKANDKGTTSLMLVRL